MKPKYTTSKLRNFNLGASLVTAITICFGGSASATTWVGDTSGDWNDNLNWSGDNGTVGSNAIINTNVPNIATINGDIPPNPVDIIVAEGGGTVGTVNHNAGFASTGTNNWMFVGRSGGTGVYNLADTTTVVPGNASGFGQGTGSINVGNAGPGGRLYIGGQSGTGSNGTFNMNTSGTLNVRNQMQIGTNGSVGVLNLDNGTINAGSAGGDDDWFEIGNGTGCTGTINMTGGTLTKTAAGNQHFIVGANGAIGNFNLSGGTVNVNSEFWVGNNAGSVGSFVFSGGTLNVSSWLAIGRGAANATGTVNMSGGTLNKTGASQFIVGANGSGIMNMTGGLVDVQGGGFTWVGEAANATTGVLTISGTAEFRSPTMSVGQSTPVAVAPALGAILNLDGGTLRTLRFNGAREQNDTGAQGGTGTVNFNGTQIIASGANTANFISNTLDNAIIGAGGLLVDSNGFNLTAPKAISGTGGVVKSGTGLLTLGGANSYGGNNTIAGGGLALSTSSTGGGSVSLANGTSFGVNSLFAGGQLITSAVTFGTSGPTTLDLNLGDVFGSNPTNSVLDVSGALAVNGVVTVNVAGSKFAVGDMPLVSYNPANLTGAGSFVLGNKPNGVVATLVVDPNYLGSGMGMVYLDITSVSLPEWDGTNEVVLTVFGDTTELSADIIVNDATGIVVGQAVRGDGIPDGTTVSVINGLTITLSQPATVTATGVNFSIVTTPGTNEGVWDTVTQNWVDQVTTLGSLYANPAPVLFSDTATGPTAVVLNSTVAPSEVLFNNSTLVYSLSGTGAIDGATGLTKQGTAGLTLSNTNTYDGVTSLRGGVTSIATFEDGGVASPIGDSSSAPANLVLAGGILEITGGADTTDRGFTVGGAGGGIRNANDLTISGQVASTGIGSGFVKQGAGNLSFTFGGANTFGAAVFAGMDIQAGTVTIDGTAGGQTNNVAGELMLASVPDVPANLTITNTTFSVESWMAIGRGNGDLGVTNLNVTNSTLTTGNFSSGWNNGQANNASEAFVNITGSTWTNNGTTNFAESPGANGGSTATLNLVNSTWIHTAGIFNMSNGDNTTSTVTISGTSELRVNRFLMSLAAGSVSNVIIEDSGSLNKTGGSWMAIGNSGTGVATVTVRDSGTLINTSGDFNLGDTASAQGILNIEDSATVTSGGVTFVGKGRIEADWPNMGTINQSGGVFNQTPYLVIGRSPGATGVYNMNGGVLNQTLAADGIIVAEQGTGTLNMNGGEINIGGGGLYITAQTTGTGVGVVHLNGGTITCKRVAERDNTSGNSTFRFNGGILKAGAGVNANFMDNLNTAVIDPGHAFIDSNSQVVNIAQALDDGGGDLHKIGAGTLNLNGFSSYLGTTFVDVGTLGGTGSVSGPLVVAAAATVNPGVTAGTFSVDSADISGEYLCEIDGANADQLAVAGALTIQPGATLDFSLLSAPGAPSFVIATFSSLSGTFIEQNVPAGFTVVYNTNNISLVQTATPYSTWATGFGLNPLGDGAPGEDADDDGQSNGIEFALGGSPISGSDNARIYNLMADSSADGDALNELLITIAVRSGTPVFAGSPSPTATMDGATYTVEGSTTLSSFTTIVTPVAPVVTGLPAAPAGYEYRTFSLNGSNGTAGAGFLRVQVNF